MAAHVLIVGGGRVGSALAALLVASSQDVHVVEEQPAVLERLHVELPGAVVHAGRRTDPGVMEKAGIRSADVVVAATRSDETNLVVASLARRVFNVPRVIGRVVDPASAWMYVPEMGVDLAINQAELIAELVLREITPVEAGS